MQGDFRRLGLLHHSRTSGIGKSSAVFRAIDLIMTKRVIEIEEPYCRIAPCIIVQCPFDSSVKGLLLEILRKVDEVLGSKYYVNALKARASVDMLIGSVSQAALNHIGLLVVDEIQNVVNSRNGKSLVGMLTQLINNSGISICMVGTPEASLFLNRQCSWQDGLWGCNTKPCSLGMSSVGYAGNCFSISIRRPGWSYRTG